MWAGTVELARLAEEMQENDEAEAVFRERIRKIMEDTRNRQRAK